MSGFYDDELEFRMSGMKVNRPQSPAKKKVNSSACRKTLKRPHFTMISIEYIISL